MNYLYPFIDLFNEMAPYLLLGFFIAGLLHVFMPKALYKRYLSKYNFKSVFWGALFGIPLPLCSCGVIPTAVSLHKEGASKSAVNTFLIATPQTGVDSIVATYSLIGLPFAIIRPIVALITSLFGGTLSNIFLKAKDKAEDSAQKEESSTSHKTFIQKVGEVIKYGFVDMVADIGKWLVVGIIIAGLITIFVPDHFFASLVDYPILNLLLILVISIPMYICATGSIPIAVALMIKGLSPGAALVLLMAGPATNIASILVIGKTMGRKSLIIYLTSIILGAIVSGLAIDYALPTEWFTNNLIAVSHHHHGSEFGWFTWACSGILLILLIYSLVIKPTLDQRKNTILNKDLRAYHVKGMTCNHCKMNVTNNLLKLDQIKNVEVNLIKGEVYIEGKAKDYSIINTLNKIGYPTEKIK